MRKETNKNCYIQVSFNIRNIPSWIEVYGQRAMNPTTLHLRKVYQSFPVDDHNHHCKELRTVSTMEGCFLGNLLQGMQYICAVSKKAHLTRDTNAKGCTHDETYSEISQWTN